MRYDICYATLTFVQFLICIQFDNPQEREGMTNLLSLGFIDTFRDLYPNKDKAYTFWSYMGGNRGKNIGWRLDYSIISDNLKNKVVDSFMRPQILGSDHCPIVLLLNI